jgi:hypothetical protein
MKAVIPEDEAKKPLAAVKKTSHGKKAVIIGEESESQPGNAAADTTRQSYASNAFGRHKSPVHALLGEGLFQDLLRGELNFGILGLPGIAARQSEMQS